MSEAINIEELERLVRDYDVCEAKDALAHSYHLTLEQQELAHAAVSALPELVEEVKRLRARLECDHVYRLKDGVMVREEVNLPEHLDGISCRDETIKLMMERINAMKDPPT